MTRPEAICGDIRSLDPTALKPTLQRLKITRIDTAARYGGGESERKIGSSGLSSAFTISTKILVVGENGDGSLTPEKIDASLSHSLEVMEVESVDVLHAHAPDFETAVEVQARGFDAQFRMGRFKRLGVSNFPPSMLKHWLHVSATEGLIAPSVYQGQYNLLSRAYESTLFLLLREHEISFTAFSPLAGGFLLGNFTPEGLQSGSRFSSDASPFKGWYDRPGMHAAVARLRKIAERTGLGMEELALRWVFWHSALSGERGDGIILGAGRVEQLERNMELVNKGPLEDEGVVRELNDLGEAVKEEAMGIVDHEKK